MDVTKELFDIVDMTEGCRLRPYICPAGYPTIARGATFYPDTGRKVTMSDAPITQARADEITSELCQIYLSRAATLSPILLQHPAKLVSIADFCFNLGETRYKSSTLRKRVVAGDWQGAYTELQKWVHGGGKVLPGLVKRRKIDGKYILM